MNKFLLTILLPFSLFSMESGNTDVSKDKGEIVEKKQTEILPNFFPGLVNDVSRSIVEYTLNRSVQENQFTDPLTDIKKLATQRSNLLVLSKSFLAEQKFIDLKVVEILKKYDKSFLNSRLLDLKSKKIKNRFVLGNLLIQAGTETKIPFIEFAKQNRKFIVEAIEQNDIRWLEFLIKNEKFPINYNMKIKGINKSFTITEQPLEVAFKLTDEYPEASLKVVKLLLENNANPFSIHLEKNPKFKNIFELYGPKKIKTIKRAHGKYLSRPAKEINDLCLKVAQENPILFSESEKAKKQAKKNPNLIAWTLKNN